MKPKYIFIIIILAILAWVVVSRNPAHAPENIVGNNPVAENPEGEANPSVMKLDMKTWNWVSATYGDGTTIKPKTAGKFSLTFKKDGTFSASTDCNGIGGTYSVNGKQITFTNMMSTLMFCEGSQEGDYRKILENTSSYFFTNKGELVFDLKFDSGSAIFR